MWTPRSKPKRNKKNGCVFKQKTHRYGTGKTFKKRFVWMEKVLKTDFFFLPFQMKTETDTFLLGFRMSSVGYYKDIFVAANPVRFLSA